MSENQSLSNTENANRKLGKKILKCTLAIFLVILAVSSIFLYKKGWLHPVFKAGEKAGAVLAGESSEYEIRELDGGALAFVPDQAKQGLIFYPGGLVEPKAYAPLMDSLANEAVLCVLLNPKTRLPMFEAGIADGMKEEFPEVADWYIGGHSMGGLAAVSYVSEHLEEFEGLVLLASYPNLDLRDSGLKVLCAYGSNDGVLSFEAYQEGKALLPADYKEVTIDGGCHSYFADYGVKGGDGEPEITMEEQIGITVKAVMEMVEE